RAEIPAMPRDVPFEDPPVAFTRVVNVAVVAKHVDSHRTFAGRQGQGEAEKGESVMDTDLANVTGRPLSPLENLEAAQVGSRGRRDPDLDMSHSPPQVIGFWRGQRRCHVALRHRNMLAGARRRRRPAFDVRFGPIICRIETAAAFVWSI